MLICHLLILIIRYEMRAKLQFYNQLRTFGP